MTNIIFPARWQRFTMMHSWPIYMMQKNFANLFMNINQFVSSCVNSKQWIHGPRVCYGGTFFCKIRCFQFWSVAVRDNQWENKHRLSSFRRRRKPSHFCRLQFISFYPKKDYLQWFLLSKLRKSLNFSGMETVVWWSRTRIDGSYAREIKHSNWGAEMHPQWAALRARGSSR